MDALDTFKNLELIPATINVSDATGDGVFYNSFSSGGSETGSSDVHFNSPCVDVDIAAAAFTGPPKTVKIVAFTDAGERKSTESVLQIRKTEDEWRKQLSPASFEVTRHAGTERPYTNENPNTHAKGVFRCICCDTALYDSKTKYESGTGWPSFWQPISSLNVVKSTDSSLFMQRDAISCRRSGRSPRRSPAVPLRRMTGSWA